MLTDGVDGDGADDLPVVDAFGVCDVADGYLAFVGGGGGET